MPKPKIKTLAQTSLHTIEYAQYLIEAFAELNINFYLRHNNNLKQFIFTIVKDFEKVKARFSEF